MMAVSLTLNGRPVSAEVESRMHLADFIRETQTLTGTHLGCEHGVCGACTVLIDGVPARSCITYAVACSGASVTTIEGLDDDEIGKELRAAFAREHALQCGYCTPGMLISARDLVVRAPAASEKDIGIAMSGNLCRCTGYVGIIRAIQSVIADRRARGIAAVPGAGRTALGPAGSGHGEAIATPAAVSAMPRSEATGDDSRAQAALDDWQPQATFEQRFVLNHTIDAVWDFFADTAAVAACLPGASISEESGSGEVVGKMRIRVGPISAQFHGTAAVDRDPATRSGRIQGRGRDQRNNSTTRGVIRYRLLPHGEDATQVELNVGYLLTGPLAQFSRSDLVQDIANRLIATFTQNVEARLSGKLDLEPAGELNAAGVFLSVLAARIRKQLSRLFGRVD
jgi:aerobic carbon-monoxide dehydrogenase small subunit